MPWPFFLGRLLNDKGHVHKKKKSNKSALQPSCILDFSRFRIPTPEELLHAWVFVCGCS